MRSIVYTKNDVLWEITFFIEYLFLVHILVVVQDGQVEPLFF